MSIAIAAVVLAVAPPLVEAPEKQLLPHPHLTIWSIFGDAGLFPKAVMVVLAFAVLAAVFVCVRKLRAGPNLAGGSAFLSSLRAGGPLLGLIGGGYSLLNVSIGVAVSAPTAMIVVMPGLIEALLTALFGLVTGVVAIAAHWAVEARIDRQVLKS